MTKQSTRLPRFSRFEYVSDLLDTASEGADWDTIEKSLTKQKYEFERLKFSATGKGKRVLPKPTKSKDLVIIFDEKNIVRAYRYTTSEPE